MGSQVFRSLAFTDKQLNSCSEGLSSDLCVISRGLMWVFWYRVFQLHIRVLSSSVRVYPEDSWIIDLTPPFMLSPETDNELSHWRIRSADTWVCQAKSTSTGLAPSESSGHRSLCHQSSNTLSSAEEKIHKCFIHPLCHWVFFIAFLAPLVCVVL